MKHTGLGMVLAALLMTAALAAADPSEEKTNELARRIEELQQQVDALKARTDSDALENLQRQVTVLAEEVEKLRSGGEPETETNPATRATLGLGPSAAKVYSKQQGVSIAGYGEMLYENPGGAGQSQDKIDEPSASGSAQIDLLRAVVYAGYRFNDRFLFNSEIEFEHATSGEGSENLGEVSVEFAHIDYQVRENLTLRGGLILMPVGLINEFHEPNVYLGARRPLTETFIIPTTWSENGFGIAGRYGKVDFRAYLVNALNAAGYSAEGLNEGLQHGSKAKIHPAFVARADVTPAAGFVVGGSIYTGAAGFFPEEGSAQLPSVLNRNFNTVLAEAHGQYNARGWDVRALYAYSSIADAATLNETLGLQGEASIGSSMGGGYIQAGYNLLARKSTNRSLIPYVRFEKTNTQKSVPEGFEKDPLLDLTVWTLGAEFKPMPSIVIKTDYQIFTNPVSTSTDLFNINMGYSF